MTRARLGSAPCSVLIFVLIIANAVFIGVEVESRATFSTKADTFETADNVFVAIFVLEAALKLLAFGVNYFFDPSFAQTHCDSV